MDHDSDSEKPRLFAEFVEISQGVFNFTIVTPFNILGLDAEDLRAIAQWLREAARSAPGKGPLCLCCDAEFTGGERPLAFAVLRPFAAKGAAVVTGICGSCAVKDNLRSNAIRAWRTVIPDLREMKGGGA